MVQTRLWRSNVLVCLLPVLLLALTGVSAQAQPAAGKAKVDRLVMGLINPYRDYMRPWINGTPDHNIQHDPAFEWLFEVDVSSGGYNPWLAKSFEMAKDGRSWRIKLQKGVQFHHGYGDFTAKDVVHNHAVWCDPNYPGRKAPTVVGYKNGMCAVQRVEVVNDHEVVLHCKVVCLDLQFYYSSASSMIIFSKAQWDKEGEMAYETKPAGTGPYVFKERELSRHVSYERAPTPHWKWGVVDWKEIKMTWNVEEPPRYAQLLAGESHLTEINRDLTDDAIAKGFKLIRSRQVAQQTVIAFGGLYFGTEDKTTKRYSEYGGITGRLDPKVPWTNKKVRQAMNKAIELELEEADLVAVVQPKVRERRANWYIRGGVPSKKAVEPQIALFNAGKGVGHWFEDDTIYGMWEELLQTSDPKAYDAQLRRIGNYKFENFEVIPLFDVHIEVVVNPKIINDWPFSGWDGGDLGHTFLISACKQEKPCK